MTEKELVDRLDGIEWDDFEVKEAKSDLPKNIWETVSAFSNTSGGWIVLGVQEEKKNSKSSYLICGVKNAEKLEQDFTGTLRSQTKFNMPISVTAKKYSIDGNVVLAFYVPSSPVKPIFLTIICPIHL